MFLLGHKPLVAYSMMFYSAILASFLLNEELGHIGRVGCALCLLGSLIIVLHAPADKDIQTVDEILHYAIQPGAFPHSFGLLLSPRTPFTRIPIILLHRSRFQSGHDLHGCPSLRTFKPHRLHLHLLCGRVSLDHVRQRLRRGGEIDNRWQQPIHAPKYLRLWHRHYRLHLSTDELLQQSPGHILNQRVRDLLVVHMPKFDMNRVRSVNPMYYVGFSTATIVASVILFQGFNTDDPANSISLLAGFVTTFLGVHLLEISRKPDSVHTHNGHSALESGLMNPRLSIQGRMSIDGWNGAGGTPIGGGPFRIDSPGHTRRSSGHRSNGNIQLFNALDEGGPDSVGLEQLPEVEEGDDEYDDEIDERTHLRLDERRRVGNPPCRWPPEWEPFPAWIAGW